MLLLLVEVDDTDGRGGAVTRGAWGADGGASSSRRSEEEAVVTSVNTPFAK